MYTDLLQHMKRRAEKMVTDMLHAIFYSKNIQRMIQSVCNTESDKRNECECTHTRLIATALTFCILVHTEMQSTLRWKKETQQLAGMASAPMIKISLSYYRNMLQYHQLVLKGFAAA